MNRTPPPWPYPWWIAHRGAGKLAPENTLAAFQVGAALGWRMFECDVKLSADERPFLLHDSTLKRTTNGNGRAGKLPWAELAELDAGSWHSPDFSGEPPPTLEQIARFVIDRGLALNIEIKPSPGRTTLTGRIVASAARSLWHEAPLPPLLSSFSIRALQAARKAAPKLPRALLGKKWKPSLPEKAAKLGCIALVLQHDAWNADTLASTREAGLRALTYTVNDPQEVQRLQALGLDGLVTDEVQRFAPFAAGAAAPAPMQVASTPS